MYCANIAFRRAKNYFTTASICLIFGAAVLPGTSYAQEDSVPIRIGDTALYTEAKLSYFTDDNALRRDNNKTEVSGWVIAPQATWKASQRATKLTLNYNGEYQFSSEEKVDFNDHKLTGVATAEFSRRSRGRLEVGVNRTHEGLGIGFTRRNPEAFETTDFDSSYLNLRHTFGSEGARGNIQSRFQYSSLSYKNNYQLTAGADRRTLAPGVELSLRLTGSTRATIGFSIADVDFDNNSKDRQDATAALGLRWNQAEKTGGSVAIGSTRANFDLESRRDISTVNVEAQMWFLPATYSRFELTAERAFEDSGNSVAANGELVEDLAVRTNLQLDWSHKWSSRLLHTARLKNVSYEVDCPADRQSTTTVSFEGKLKVRRWLGLGLGIANQQRKTDCVSAGNEVVLDYEQLRVMLSVTGTL